ncbi:DMT family transporter [Falsigemmobacter intermedius]|nr:DMT family transporter [Falsigemmobacter intermedius]
MLTAPLKGHLAMLGFSALVAGSFTLGARVANLVDPAALTLLRFVLALVVTSLVLVVMRTDVRGALQGGWRWLLPGAIYAGYFVLMFEGLKTATPLSSAAVFTLSPILSAGFGWWLLRQGMTRRMAFALAIGAFGALWVIFRGEIAAALRLEIGRGEVIYFIGCLLHAALPALMRRISRGEPPMLATTMMLTGGLVVLTPWALPKVLATDWAALPGIVWATLGYTAICTTAMTAALMQYASQRLPGAKVMAYTYLVPGWVIAWELAFGAQTPPGLVAGGVGITVLALLLLLKDERVS